MPHQHTVEKPIGVNLKLKILTLICLIIVPAIIVLVLLYIKGFEEQIKLQYEEIGRNTAEGLDRWFGKEIELETSQVFHDETEEQKKQRIRDKLQKEVERLITGPTRLREITIFLLEGDNTELKATSVDRKRLYPSPSEQDMTAMKSGKVILERRKSDEGQLLDISTPLHIKGAIDGVIHMAVAVTESERWLASANTHLMIWTIVVLLVIAVTLYIYLNIAISNPIKRLVEGMEQATRGNLQATVNIDATGEIAWLTMNLNKMLRQISHFNKELEQKIHDATKELERKNEELSKANEMLFTIQRKLSQTERLASLGQLSTTLAHELGTTLNVIAGHIQIMSANGGLNEEAKSRLNLVDSQLDRLTAIIRNVLKTMRLPEPTFYNVDINNVIKDITTFIMPTLTHNNIKLELKLGGKPSTIRADRYQLEQVFMNLLSNAIDAMPKGGRLTVETKFIEENSGDGNKYVSIIFSDTGDGIDGEDVKKIFEPFFSTKKDGARIGIGLAICQQIIKNHNGFIEVKSDVGRGTTFYIRLPIESGTEDISDAHETKHIGSR